MKTSRRTRWLLAAAVAALPAMAFVSPASAQYQNGQNGHALDANTQVGSGGQNYQSPNSSAVSGNQIVTGNSTGGTYFRGPVPYFDPKTFDGPLASQGNDDFVRDSHGVPTPYAPAFNPYQSRSFYSASSLTSAPPPGSVLETYQNAVVGTGLIPASNTAALASPLDAYRDLNPGGTTVFGLTPGTYVNPVSSLPAPGNEADTLATANPLITTSLFANSQTNELTGEPLPFSVAQPQLPNMADRFSQNPTEQLANPFENPNSTTGQPSTANKGNLPAQSNPNSNGATGNKSNAPGDLLPSNPLNSSINTQQNNNPNQNQTNTENPLGPSSMLNQQPMNTPQTPYNQNSPSMMTGPINNSALGSSLATNQSSRQWLTVPAAQQSTQYRELQKRLDEFNSDHQLTDQDVYQQFQQQQRALKHAGAAGAAATNNPGPQGPNPSGGGPGAGAVNTPGAAPAPSGGNPIKPSALVPVPVHVTSLADGVRNVQLKTLLTSAEDAMRQDKFASAAEKYDAAIKLTDNTNPMILLGRANAELGAEFYSRAEADLRHAVAQDPSLLMGQYDLPAMMNAKRLEAVRTDLEALAKVNQSVRPALLLAYLDYNTGHESDAAKYLTQAESLVGNSDPVIELMRTHWILPKSGGENK